MLALLLLLLLLLPLLLFEDHARLVRPVEVEVHRRLLELALPRIWTHQRPWAERCTQGLVEVRVPLGRGGAARKVLGARDVASMGLIPVASIHPVRIGLCNAQKERVGERKMPLQCGAPFLHRLGRGLATWREREREREKERERERERKRGRERERGRGIVVAVHLRE